MMEDLTAYISPELLGVVPVLYAIGFFIKGSERVPDNLIPLILGGVGIVICWLYEFMTLGFGFEAVFCGIIQGVLTAGATVYANQIKKQMFKKE